MKNLRKGKVPKGSHEMPDGSIMKDKDMPKPPVKKKKKAAPEKKKTIKEMWNSEKPKGIIEFKKTDFKSAEDFIKSYTSKGFMVSEPTKKFIVERFKNTTKDIVLQKKRYGLDVHFTDTDSDERWFGINNLLGSYGSIMKPGTQRK